MKLQIAKDLALPIDTVTQTIAVLAKRRAGKSYTMRRIAEQLVKAGQQVVIVDPKGDQWGIRSAADGKAPGLAVVILGGERGDVPLEPSAGEVVAKLVVEERVSVLLDLSLFRKHEVATFMTAFLENVYRLKARETYRTPMMLIIDEADAIAPQKPQKGEERMLGAAEDIVRRGGQRGIGCVLVTQRSAVLNKNVLTQAQMLVALRTIAPQDLAAMKAWVDVHGTLAQQQTLMASLPALPVGDAWFWAPGWPTTDGIFKRVHVLPIETFDSGATPKAGEKRVEPKQAADVDLEALQRQMAATIEKAKADDPRELRKQIAELKKQLSAQAKERTPAPPTVKTVEKFVLKDGQLARAEKVVARIDQLAEKYSTFEEDLRVTAKEIRDALTKASQPPAGRREEPTSRAVPALAPAHRAEVGRRVRQSSPSSSPGRPPAPTHGKWDVSLLPPGEHATLTAALQYPDGLEKKRLGILTGYKRSSRDAYVARLAQKGLIETRGVFLYATDAGRAALNGSFERLPTGADLVDYWRSRLPNGERATLDVLLEAAGDDVAREAIDEATGYRRSSRDAYLTRLKARGLVEFSGRGTVRASAELFS